MTRTIWLASYPKSGNTWFRMLIANLATSDGKPVDINRIPPAGMASTRHRFDDVVLIDSGLLTHDEIDNLRPRAHAAIARYELNTWLMRPDVANPVQFLKVHDAYTMNSAGQPILGGAEGAHGAILIVRDPRDVAPSLAHFSGITVDEAITAMNDDDAMCCAKTNRQHMLLREKHRSWSGNVASWLDQTDIPIYLIRYEDLQSDTAATLRGALTFAGLQVTDEEINQAVVFSDFAKLHRQECNSGFAESPRIGTKFFRRGQVGSWRDELTPEQVVQIESRHGKMMQRLGYEVSYLSDLAQTG